MRQDDSVSRKSASRRGASAATATVAAAITPPAAPVERWIRQQLAQDPPRAQSLIVTVWGDSLAPHGGSVWLSSLIALMAAFGVNERLVRTSVFRLVKDGWLEAKTHGRRSRYRLTAAGARRFAQAHDRIYFPSEPAFDGEWEIAILPPEAADAATRQALRDELAWEGFGTLPPGVHLRPRHGGSALPRILRALKLSTRVTVLRARDDPEAGLPTLADRVKDAWDLDELARGYRRFTGRFGRLMDVLGDDDAPADPRQCFVARTLLIHAYRRSLLRDPQLPAALLPADWPGAAAYALCRACYRRIEARAEAHLAATLGGDAAPAATHDYRRRFGGLEDATALAATPARLLEPRPR